MSERNPSPEREDTFKDAISKYYLDIQTVKDGTQAMMTFNRLLESIPFQFDYTIQDFWQADEAPLRVENSIDDSITRIYAPFKEEFEDNPRIAKEKLALLPFEYIGYSLEQSAATPQRIRDWYGEALRGAMGIVRIAHDGSREHKRTNAQYFVCDKSAICPHRYLEAYFGGHAILPDFSSREYQEDPYRIHDITVDKLEAAIDHDVFMTIEGETLKSQYEDKFKMWIRNQSGRPLSAD